MLRRAVPFLFALACLSAAPLIAQEPAAPAPVVPQSVNQTGPRLQAGYPTYQPALAPEASSTAAAAAAADRTVITISTLGLILLVVLLVILIA